MSAPPPPDVVAVPEASRYELREGGRRIGRLDYIATGAHRTITHTEVDPAQRGRGLSLILIRGALDDLRAHGHPVSNRCPAVTRFVARNPDYAELIGPELHS